MRSYKYKWQKDPTRDPQKDQERYPDPTKRDLTRDPDLIRDPTKSLRDPRSLRSLSVLEDTKYIFFTSIRYIVTNIYWN